MNSAPTSIDEIRKALVHITDEGSPEVLGLGIMCEPFILTCGHFMANRQLPTHFHDSIYFNVRRICDGEEAVFMLYLATTMDFMALSENGIHVSGDCGPSDNASILFGFPPTQPRAIRPAMIQFGGNLTTAKFPGFFFSPDGQTVHHVELKVFRDDPIITYESNDMIPGCSGGPIFTDDFHLIGIHTSGRKAYQDDPCGEGVGKRIDLCCPLLLRRQIKWDVLDVKSITSGSLPGVFPTK